MPDIRSLQSGEINGKLIYQLTAASALKDTDLFPISSSNLTRQISLSQLKSSFKNDFYSKDEIDNLLDAIRLNFGGTSGDVFDLYNVIAEFKNEINNKFQNFTQNVNESLNNLDKKINDNYQYFDLRYSTLNKKIQDINTQLGSLIQYGTSVPTTLPKGQVYIQYF